MFELLAFASLLLILLRLGRLAQLAVHPARRAVHRPLVALPRRSPGATVVARLGG